MISAGVMIANVSWKATNTIVGIVCAVPSVGTTSAMLLHEDEVQVAEVLAVTAEGQVNPIISQVTLTIAIAAKFCISIASMCLARTMPP